MKKITYLFGAGASRNALPIVNEIPERITELIELLSKSENSLDDTLGFDDLKPNVLKSRRALQLELIESLNWMLLESSNHASVDTFAKKLTIRRKYHELKKLKLAMSVFFIFEQVRKKPDPRYDSFLASIINSNSDFPPNVRLLSWNYDYQFEIAHSEYIEQNELSASQSWLGVKHKYGDRMKDNGFGIYKLNGTTGLYSEGGWRQFVFTNNLKVDFTLNLISEITRNFAAGMYLPNIESSLSFAWEPENQNNSIVDKAIESISDTYSLLVIGYSFPFFNREIDRRILNSMTSLKRVYFQAPDAENLKERFQALRDDLTGLELIVKHDLAQFLLPNEL